MNKKYIPGVIIVEGSHDASKISLLYDSIFVITNGYEIPNQEINFIKAIKEGTQTIVLTDKDEAGQRIRNRINKIRQDVINIEIEAPKSSKKKGVAECYIKDIKNALDKYTSKPDNYEEINLYNLGLVGKENSKEIRKIISNKFNLGIVNKNNMIKRLYLLGISNEELKKEIEICNK
ncbi:MAG: DUF4093 domain-containing protein [Bacilli bacterium]|nr:DUF4093 domain-containing protein [Bacilli bacterium]